MTRLKHSSLYIKFILIKYIECKVIYRIQSSLRRQFFYRLLFLNQHFYVV